MNDDLKTAIYAVKEDVKNLREEVCDYRKEQKEHLDEIRPLIELIRSMSFGRKAILYISVTISAVGGAILILKKLW